MSKVSTCLWFGKDAEEAVGVYVSLMPDSRVEHVQRSPGPWPGGDAGDALVIRFLRKLRSAARPGREADQEMILGAVAEGLLANWFGPR